MRDGIIKSLMKKCSAEPVPNRYRTAKISRTKWVTPAPGDRLSEIDSPVWRLDIEGLLTPNSSPFGLSDRRTHITFNRTRWKRVLLATLVDRTRSDASQPSSELTQLPSDVENSNQTRCLV